MSLYDIFVLSYLNFKKFIHAFTQNLKLYFEEKIRYQKVLNIFLGQMAILSTEKTTLIIFKDLEIDNYKITKDYLLD